MEKTTLTRVMAQKRFPYYPVLIATLLWANSFRLAPMPSVDGPPNFDKLLHFLFFGFLATTIIRIPSFRLSRAGPWLAWVATVLVGAFDEIFQVFSPFRTPDPADLLYDALGAALAIALYLKVPPYRRTLEFQITRRP